MKLVSLMSDGIDSPVASYLMAKMGADVILLHMDNRPYTDDRSLEKVQAIAERLRDITGKDFPLYVAPHGDNQTEISELCDKSYQCVMCKRVMQRTAKELAIRLGATAIIMGDSLGQVASQTLRNIRSENIGLDFPVARPLIGLDKLEIEAIAKDIGTYDISIRQTAGCTIVPIKPVTEATPEKIAVFAEKLDVDALARSSADSAERQS